MCILTDNRVDCYDCGYPSSESRYLNNGSLTHDSTQEEIDKYISQCDDVGVYVEDNTEG